MSASLRHLAKAPSCNAYMNAETRVNRRDFLARTASAATMSLAGLKAFGGAEKSKPRFPLIGFSKPFRELGFEQAAALVERVGWDGIECPVRNWSTHIEPKRVEEDLPKFVDALNKRQKKIHIVTTSVRSADDPLSEKVLRTISKLGIQRYRLAFWKYDLDRPIQPQIEDIRAQLKDLVALNKELGLKAGFQNHSGQQFVGAPVWDIYDLIKDMDPRYIGGCFDIGHATLEGGYAWPLHARRMIDHLTAVFVKDFYWAVENNEWRAKWCPLGHGMVKSEFFKWLKSTPFQGPISQHHEYDLGKPEASLRLFKRDLRVLKKWLAAD